MKVMTKSQAKELKLDSSCSAIEYEMGDKDINVAIIFINGRSPTSGRVVNSICKEMAYVMKGSGKILIEDKEIVLNQGDMIIIDPGERYFWNGNMTLFVPCAPAWEVTQSKLVK
jgi:mannose-6-phosphate isomerase-like protein (cupin superfamily)